jgi:branched-chain amino acid transport system substrate-binding protein
MRRAMLRALPVVAFLLVLSMIVVACGDDEGGETTTTAAGSTTTAGRTDAITIGHLSYATGAWGGMFEMFNAPPTFTMNLINESGGVLGRQVGLINQDIGTIGEAQAARKLVEQDRAEIILSSAHEYMTYRDWMLETIASTDHPVLPTVHGGVICGNLGGTPQEPIFRAQGLDEAMGAAAILYLQGVGAQSVVIIATQETGYQITADATENAAGIAGIEVLERIDAALEQASYRTEIERAAALNPDALVIFATMTEGGTMVKQAAEAGLSLYIYGETGWSDSLMFEAATADSIAAMKAVVYPSFGIADNPAATFFTERWNASPESVAISPADLPYNYTTYDVLTATFLAFEQAGQTNASTYAPAMFDVTDGGTKCYSFPECQALIAAGTDIDYDGVTGSMHYSPTGINEVIWTVRQWNPDGTATFFENLDPAALLELTGAASRTCGE